MVVPTKPCFIFFCKTPIPRLRHPSQTHIVSEIICCSYSGSVWWPVRGPAGLSWRERETLRLHWLGLGIWSLARRFPRELGRSWWVVLVLVWAGASGEVRGAETSSFATIWLLSFSFFCTFCFNAAQTVEIWRLSPTPMKVVDWLGVSVILKNSLNT